VKSPLLLALLCACSPNNPPTNPPPEGCARFTFVHATPASAKHLPDCQQSACGNAENPPTGGDHCPVWLACRKYAAAQPRCSWLHNLEHGHAVIAYSDGAVKADAEAFFDKLATPRRLLVTPDAALPKKVSAVVWGWSWSGDAWDEDAVKCLLAHQDKEAPEAGLPCDP
jgi:hypothetical protein